MFWGKKHSHRNSDHNDKEKQIKELKSVFPSIRRPNNDDNLFSIQFCVDNKYSALKIFIPAEFPNIRPVLQVDGPVSHPWLDQFKQVNGCEKLIHWSRTSSLVSVIEETIATLSTGTNNDPSRSSIPNLHAQLSGVSPMPSRHDSRSRQNSLQHQNSSSTYSSYPGAASTSSNYYGNQYQSFTPQQSANFSNDQNFNMNPTEFQPAIPVPPSYMNDNINNSGSNKSNNDQQYYSQNSIQSQNYNGKLSADLPASLSRQASDNLTDGMSPGSKFSLPDLPNSFPELENMTNVQLERLLSDDVALQSHIDGLKLETIKSMESLITQMQDANIEALDKNLVISGELNILERELKKEQDSLRSLVKDYENEVLSARIEYAVPADEIMKELKKNKDVLDEAGEVIGRAFVNGEKDLPSFISEYLDHRIRYHTLCTKITCLESKNK